MAGPHITKLHQLPWPALVGASVLLHIGVLAFSVPRLLRIGAPTESTVNIPVTLVDEARPPVDVAPPLVQTAPPPVSSAPRAIGGRDMAVEPTAPNQPAPPSEDVPMESPIAPPEPERVNTSETTPENQSPIQEPLAPEEEGVAETDQEAVQTMPTAVSILGDIHLPKAGGGDQIDEYPTPMVQWPFTLPIPSGHSCAGTLSTETINLGVLIDAEGWVSSFSLYQPTIYDQTPELKVADCLLSVALRADPNAVRFSPAIRISNIGEEEAIPTDRVQLTLQFDGG